MKRTAFNNSWIFTNKRTGESKNVTLPHDAMIHDDRTPDSPSGSAGAYFVPGTYTYEKEFEAPADWKESHVELAFGTVYKDAEIFLNGEKIAFHAYGFTPFNVSLDGHLKFNSKNYLKVVANNSDMPNCRWYSGAGIYAPVYVVTGNKNAYIRYRGVKIDTIDISNPTVRVRTDFVADEDLAQSLKVRVSIYDRKELVATAEGTDTFIEIPGAKLWSENTPDLYIAKVELLAGDVCIDEVSETFGIRIVSVSTEGFFVNGISTKLRGGCLHPDNGILGACTYIEAEERKIRNLKKLGFNAIRAAHNPVTEEMLRACDKYGMYIMDETFDMWYQRKNKYDYARDFERDWRSDTLAMIEQDYNHPSVVMYSIGNELSEPVDFRGLDTCDLIYKFIKQNDPSRPITAGGNIMILTMAGLGNAMYQDDGNALESASNNGSGLADRMSGSLIFNTIYQKAGSAMNLVSVLPMVDSQISPFFDKLDVAGYNYGSARYLQDLKKHPNRVIVGSETLPFEIYKNWEKVKSDSRIIGDFMWPGIEYLGETGLATWSYDGTSILNVRYPYLTYGSGAIDLIGDPDVAGEYASVVWRFRDRPYIGVRPVNHIGEKVTKGAWRGTNARASWSWRGCHHAPAKVEVYSNATYVKLVLNGETVGVKRVKENKAIFDIVYEQGDLIAIEYDQIFQIVGEAVLSSATGKLSIKAEPETDKALVGSVVFVPVSIVGENGVVESNNDEKLKVTVKNGELLGFGSANFKSAERFDTGEYTTFYGRALAVVRVGEPGKTTVTVSSAVWNQEDAVAEITVL